MTLKFETLEPIPHPWSVTLNYEDRFAAIELFDSCGTEPQSDDRIHTLTHKLFTSDSYKRSFVRDIGLPLSEHCTGDEHLKTYLKLFSPVIDASPEESDKFHQATIQIFQLFGVEKLIQAPIQTQADIESKQPPLLYYSNPKDVICGGSFWIDVHYVDRLNQFKNNHLRIALPGHEFQLSYEFGAHPVNYHPKEGAGGDTAVQLTEWCKRLIHSSCVGPLAIQKGKIVEVMPIRDFNGEGRCTLLRETKKQLTNAALPSIMART